MRKAKQHIATILLGVFFFPLLIQPVHVLWHHRQQESGCHHGCAAHHQEPEESDSRMHFTDLADHCPICEYTFPITTSPDLPRNSNNKQLYPDDACPGIIIPPQPPLILAKSPRAPPRIGIPA